LATGQPPFIATRIVPIADCHEIEDLTFADSIRQATAANQLATADIPIGGQASRPLQDKATKKPARSRRRGHWECRPERRTTTAK